MKLAGVGLFTLSLLMLFSRAASFLGRKAVTSRVSGSATRLMATEVRGMSIQEFGDIIKDKDSRGLYQIVDVRESGELAASRIQGDDIIHLPLSTAGEWTQDIQTGKLLDSDKPVLCLCRAGVRSMQLAQFLASQDFDVYNVSGGMMSYFNEVDSSVGSP